MRITDEKQKFPCKMFLFLPHVISRIMLEISNAPARALGLPTLSTTPESIQQHTSVFYINEAVNDDKNILEENKYTNDDKNKVKFDSSRTVPTIETREIDFICTTRKQNISI